MGIICWISRVQIAIPPHTGIGDLEDSLGSVYKLVPKPPKKNYDKLMGFDGEVYRFQVTPQRPRIFQMRCSGHSCCLESNDQVLQRCIIFLSCGRVIV